MVSKEAAEAFVEGIEAALRDVGVGQPYDLGLRVSRWVEDNHKLFAAMRSRHAFIEFVQCFPDETETHLPLAMALLQAVPAIAQAQIPKLLHRVANEHPLPALPGRPQVIDDAVKLDICDGVAALHREGVQLSVSQVRVAKRYGVGVRSVQRVWRQRSTLKDSTPKSFAHLFRAIQGLGD